MKKIFGIIITALFSTTVMQAQTNTFPASGNVGIGTASPSSRLHLVNGGQNLKFLTGTNTSGYSLDVGVNDDGVNFINNSISRGYNFGNASGSLLKLTHNGNVGIGTISPESKLHIESDGTGLQITPISSNSNVAQSISVFNVDNDAATADVDASLTLIGAQNGSYNQKRVRLRSLGTTGGSREGVLVIEAREQTSGSDIEVARFEGNGNVGIGTSNPDQKLTVKGKIHSEEVIVDLNVPGPDYVFEEDYDLTTLKELEAYIKANKHLPEIPSSKEMEANGITLGEMNMLLLKKIEELTLYVIAQEGMIQKEHKIQEELTVKLKNQEKAILELFKRIEMIENTK